MTHQNLTQKKRQKKWFHFVSTEHLWLSTDNSLLTCYKRPPET